MQEIIQEVLKEMNDNIHTLKEQMKAVESIDWTKPVDRNTWKQLCETPIRGTHVLELLVQNIFPEATSITQSSDYVIFHLYGFECKLPTYQGEGIYVDTSWYDANQAPPIDYLKHHKMYQYFKRKDEGAGWEELFDIRFSYQKNISRFWKGFLWFGKYKWKDDHRTLWEDEFKKQEKKYNEALATYHDNMRKMYRKIETFQDFLIPELSNFTDDIRPTKEIAIICNAKQL